MPSYFLDTVIGLITTIISFAFGISFRRIHQFITKSLPTKRLWRLNNGDTVSFVIANPPPTFRRDESEFTK
ncbi:hypothetical protein V7112_05195, partial [Bacillus sp. JJ1566]|uniref:hypothetical protein n=1 Tax=Bacillus sp. JJ1566 TaxID=3122961 RepID=UPI002FFFD226